MSDTVANFTGELLRELPSSIYGDQRLVAVLSRAVELVGAELSRQVEDEKQGVKLDCPERWTALGELTDIRAGLSNRAADFEVVRSGSGDTYFLISPSVLKDRTAPEGSKSVLTRVRASERMLEREIVLRHHDLLVVLQGRPVVAVVDEDDEWRDTALPNNQIALIRFRDSRRFDIHGIADFLSDRLPVLREKLSAVGRFRFTLDDLRSIPLPNTTALDLPKGGRPVMSISLSDSYGWGG